MKKITILIASAILLASCATQTAQQETATPNPSTPISSTEIDQTIFATLQQKGSFEWSSVSDEMVWSAAMQSDHIISVGYQPEGEQGVNAKIHTINIEDEAWKKAKEQVLTIILEEESKTNKLLNRASLMAFEETVLPVVDVRIDNLNTLKKLRQSNLVRYAEPMGYEPKPVNNAQLKVASSSGCGSNTAQTDLNSTDFSTITPNAKTSWNYGYHGVTQAWSRSTGAGVKITIIDTGSSNGQENLGSTFNQGLSSGRTTEKLVTLPRNTFLGIPTGSIETPDDGCGHGTSMQGAACAPRGTDGNTAGIAYNANLISIRAAADVFLDESRESKGVADAFTLAGNRADVKIISMSMGRLTSSSQIADAVRYAYGKGKLIFCAAGTSLDWTAGFVGVIFPANMAEAVAVTGIKDNLTQRCDACHEGADVEFVVVMEKATNGRKPLSLAMTGDTPSTVGGSSVATASTAGMAALVWAQFPTLTRAQILEKLKQNASYYPSRNSNFGWGRINVNNALN
jgi:subtilisin family serine protease